MISCFDIAGIVPTPGRETLSHEVTGVPTCQNCASFVTPRFVRVFGTNGGEVFACPDCAPLGELMEGKAARQNA